MIVITIIVSVVLIITMLALTGSVEKGYAELSKKHKAARTACAKLDQLILATEKSNDDLRERIGQREQDIDLRQADLKQVQAKLAEVRKKPPVRIYISDRLPKRSRVIWQFTISARGGNEADASRDNPASWTGDRAYLITGETKADARRRLEAKFPSFEGYKISGGTLFDLEATLVRIAKS